MLDDFDAYLNAFGYTFCLFLVSSVLSMILGTILAAMRVGPISVLRTPQPPTSRSSGTRRS